MLDTEYFLKLLQFIGEHTRERTKGKRKALTEERRKHYSGKDWDAYDGVIKKALDLEDTAAQSVLKETIEALEIGE